MKIQDIKERRSGKIAEMRSLNEKAQGENRDLSTEERTRFDALEGEVRGLSQRLTDAEKLAEFERFEASADPMHGGGEMRREMHRYSLAKALSESRSGSLTGLEAEVHRELSMGRETRGVMVPTDIILGGETRALTSATPGAAPGSNMIATNLGAMTDRRRAALKIESMGATVLRGLTGNLDLPRLAQSGSAAWVAEHTNAPRSDAGFEKKSMGPKTVSAEYEISRRMLLQANQALEPVLRADLAFLLAQKLDAAAIRGGGANEPTGILADTDVAAVLASAELSDTAADLIAALETDDVTGTRAFLTNPAVMALARKIKDANGRPISLSEKFHGERVESSTQVPGDLGGTTDKDALIYGEWASLYLGYWSGVDLMVNPYHSDVASKGGALLHAFLDCDVVVRHPEAFRYAEI
jgi:HK97 family phage major capsid protein